MKKIITMLLAIIITQVCIAQKKCSLGNEVPWIVLNGQMVNDVHPPKPNVSSNVIQIKTNAVIEIVQTEEMETLTKTETIGGVQRWFVTYKTNKARTISTVIIKCGCEVLVKKLEQPVKLSNR